MWGITQISKLLDRILEIVREIPFIDIEAFVSLGWDVVADLILAVITTEDCGFEIDLAEPAVVVPGQDVILVGEGYAPAVAEA